MKDSTKLPLPCFLLEEKKLIRNLKLIKSVKKKAGIEIILAFKAYSLWHSFPLIKKISGWGYCQLALGSTIML